MICPDCNREHREGATHCIDDMSYVGLYRDPGYASLAKEYLETNGVDAVPIDYPYDDVSRVYVHDGDEEKARDLLNLFDNSGIEERRKEERVEDDTDTPKESASSLTAVGMFFIFISLLGLLRGLTWIDVSWELIRQKMYVHGPLVFALGVFTVIFILVKLYGTKSNNTRQIYNG